MTGTTHPQAAAYDTWAEVIVLLEDAADCGYRDSATDPALHSTALAAHALAAAALELLPVAERARVDRIPPPPAVTSSIALIRAAEAATRRHPIDDLPAGASEIIVAICDLIGELGA